mgnify:CR=1 FL=1
MEETGTLRLKPDRLQQQQIAALSMPLALPIT